MNFRSSLKSLFAVAAIFATAGLFALDSAWLTDFNAAKKAAKSKSLPILLCFSGSDWCGWCIKLDKEVFETPEFKAYAKENLVLLNADFPHKKKLPSSLARQNEDLVKKFNVEGFPSVVILDADGKLLVDGLGYQKGGGTAYVEMLKSKIPETKKAAKKDATATAKTDAK